MSQNKILIVDDSLTIRMQIARLLEQNGFNSILAKDGMKCLELLEKEEPDVILLDIIMPEMDGIEVCKKIKENKKWKNIPILLLTAISDTDNKVKGLYAGADDYITKPFETMELMARINVMIRNKNLQDELRFANQKILEQQKSVIQEERLKVLLQMSGATALELDQPINELLRSVEGVKKSIDDSDNLLYKLNKIEKIGQDISNILKKMHSLSFCEDSNEISESQALGTDHEISILSVENFDEDYNFIESLLDKHENISLTRAKKFKDAIFQIKHNNINMILMEYNLPDGNGIDFLNNLSKEGIEIPAIVVTSLGDEMIAAQMIQAGAYNYISKDRVNEKSFINVILNTLEKARLKKEVKEAQKKMALMSIKDSLTELFNRRYFTEVLKTVSNKAVKDCIPFVLCIIDLDHFKQVNDTYGHPTGDIVLIEIAKIIINSSKESGYAFRYGGEEFAIIIYESDIDNAHSMCESLRKKIMSHNFFYEKKQFSITASFGIAFFNPLAPLDNETLIAKADKALYRAKKTGRNKIELNI